MHLFFFLLIWVFFFSNKNYTNYFRLGDLKDGPYRWVDPKSRNESEWSILKWLEWAVDLIGPCKNVRVQLLLNSASIK